LVAERIKQLKGQNRHYLAHEYFNRDWHPMHFATMAEWLAPAKLQFASSAHYLDQFDALNLSQEQQAFLNDIPDPMFRQSVRDFMTNQQFRRDYWVKGARRLSGIAQAEALSGQRVVLMTPRADVSLKVKGALGEASMNAAVYEPILDAMADHTPRTIAEVQRAVNLPSIDFLQVLQTMIVLTGAGHVQAAQSEEAAASVQTPCDRLNVALLNRARGGGEIGTLASPVTAGGVSVSWFEQLFLTGYLQTSSPNSAQAHAGDNHVERCAAHAWTVLRAQGQKVLKDGSVLATDEENLSELRSQAQRFLERRLPVLRALKVVG
jgi:PAS domain-containing protein